MIQQFDRNQFKKFAEENFASEKPNCVCNHSEIVKHKLVANVEWETSFRAINNVELQKNYLQLGSLRDNKINTLNYIEFNNKEGEFWSVTSKIATNFYPYHNCDVYTCKNCKKLFLVYTEYSGHAPEQRIRNVKTNLIVEEPSNCTLKIPTNKITILLTYLQLEPNNFEEILEENKTLERVQTNFNTENLLIKKLHENHFLFVAKRETIYQLISLFQ